MMFKFNQYYTSLGIRVTQLVFSIITLGLGAAMVHELAYNRTNYVVATGVLSMIYLALLLIPQVLVFIPVVAVVAGDIIFAILWLACFACIADVYGSVSCGDFGSYDGYYYYSFSYLEDQCKQGKGVIAIGVLTFLLFLVSSGLLIFFSLLPSLKSKTSALGDQFMFGGLFLKHVTPPVVNEESTVGTEGNIAATDSTDINGTETIDPAEKVESPVSADPEPEISGEPEVSKDPEVAAKES